MSALLEVEDLAQSFGGVEALRGITLSLGRGEIASLIGPNGAGKTTFFNVITGLYPGSRGRVHFDGRAIRGLPCHDITALGIARTFQNIRLFPSMTAIENVMVGRHCRTSQSLLGPLLASASFRAEESAIAARAGDCLEFVGLRASANELARQLSYGSQRRLEIARAMACEPRLLILDEPTAGMNIAESLALIELIRKVRARGITVLLIEHQMRVVMDISERVIVFDHGELISQGTPREVVADPRVIEAYLGHSA